MALNVIRALFILLVAAVGWSYAMQQTFFLGQYTWLSLAIAIAVGTLFVCIDILSPRRKLAFLSGAFLGLIVGLAAAWAMSFVVRYVVETWRPIQLSDFSLSPMQQKEAIDQMTKDREILIQFIDMIVGCGAVYLTISFILQTKDDFRFIIPYVEFTKQTRGARPMLLDTSVLIDGRIGDIADTGLIESRILVPRFVLDELQTIADSADRQKRNRGRRGLDVIQKLQNNRRVEVTIYELNPHDEQQSAEVDQKLMALAKELTARVVTTDFNLNKVAQLRGVDVINVNDLANALKPVVLPGEKMLVRLIKPGEESGQGVGYLADGTMVVVEQGRAHLNEEIEFTVTSALQTSAGKMIFGRIGHQDHPSPPPATATAAVKRPRPRETAT